MNYMSAKGKIRLLLTLITLAIFTVACGNISDASVPEELERIVAENRMVRTSLPAGSR